jgi:hypothetical protein
MVTKQVAREMHVAWLDLEEAVKTAYNIATDDHLDNTVLNEWLKEGDDEQAKTRIAWLRAEAQTWRTMKFIGER